jgi:hypothetical protein
MGSEKSSTEKMEELKEIRTVQPEGTKKKDSPPWPKEIAYVK